MRTAGKMGIVTLSVVLVLVLGLATAYFCFEQLTAEPLPNPNGYDDFTAAGKALIGKVPDSESASIEECRDYIATNQLALDRGRLGLTRSCRIPAVSSLVWARHHVEDIMATKSLVGAFCLEGDVAKRENRPDKAAASYLTAIKVGTMSARGGVMIDGLVATACQAMGVRRLDSEMGSLSAEECRKLIAGLEEVETEQEPAAAIMTSERRWLISQLVTVDGFKEYLKEVADAKSLRPEKAIRARFVSQYEARSQWVPQLKAKLAVRAYFLEKGRWPAAWGDLVPGYLKQDPKVSFPPSDTNAISFKEPAAGVLIP